MKALLLVIAVAILGEMQSAQAAPIFSDGTVQAIETGAMPGTVLFANTANSAICPQNPVFPNTGWLWFSSSNTDTNKAVYAAVLGAYLSGKILHLTWDTITCQLSSVRSN